MTTAVNKEGATRHLPTGRGVARGQQNREKHESDRPKSEPRLQAAAVKRTDDERDPYADVPCTD